MKLYSKKCSTRGDLTAYSLSAQFISHIVLLCAGFGRGRTKTPRNTALAFCDLRLWLAFRNGKPVGRIAGIINRKCNELKNQQRIRFGWFDTIDDPAVAKALMSEVETWGRSENLTEISGPSRFSNMEKQGRSWVSINAFHLFGIYYSIILNLEQLAFKRGLYPI